MKLAWRVLLELFLLFPLSFPLTCPAAWQLIWNDEFTQADGTSPDSTKWAYDIGTGSGGWGNNELEYYTSRTNNARIENGQLVIEARQESYQGSSYTSARLKTQGKWTWTYGRMEARIRLPRTQGIWPAFWMLGNDIGTVGWPTCGEIDIMEHIGKEPKKVYGTIHGPGYSGGSGIGGSYTSTTNMADDFHVFAIEWQTNVIRWYMDSIQYFSATPGNLAGKTWVFNHPFFLILNVAVGGNWPGYPDATSVFPQTMLVDYVRVYNYVSGPPNVPTGFSAVAGDATAYLSWNTASGASGYLIKRATNSSGPYAVVGSTTSNGYQDAGLVNCANYYYVVCATNTVGTSPDSAEQAVSLGSYAWAVNCGGGAAVQFSGDSGFSGGTQAAASTASIDTSGVASPAPQSVYQTERYGNFTYTRTGLTPGANYRVRLHFAETYWTAAGQRRFNVFINSAQVLANFDVLAAAGAANKAVVREFTAAAPGGQITVQYATVTDNAKASGIEVLLPQPPSPVAGNNGPIWEGTPLYLTATTVPGASYSWTGPAGFASTEQNPSIARASATVSGVYSVTAAVGGCTSAPATTTVTVNPPPTVTVQRAGTNIVLSWPAGMLQAATNLPGFWLDLPGAASPYTNPAADSKEFFRLKLQ